MKDYKDTLLMGKTNFEMRGNLGQKEPLIQEKWNQNHVYEKVLEKNKGLREYTLHDGPPYANGDIHLGHALNKILKDIIVRYKNMNGFYSLYIPGWDTHGLPIENALQKSGVNRKEIPLSQFRDLCAEYAYKQVERQKVGFRRLGVMADWDHPYITLTHDFERDQIRVFGKMVERGLIYKGLKPVYWSPSSESALAEAEIEYKDVTSKSIYFKFPIVEQEGELKGASFLVWTTTPWTLPGNVAVCAGPEIDYCLIDSNKGKLLCAEALLNALKESLGLENINVLKRYKGNELLNIKYKHPLYDDRFGISINADYVTTTDGTGFVHIAPGYGEEDYEAGKKYGLPMLVYVDDKGIQMPQTGKYAGMFYEKSEDPIIEDLKEKGLLLKLQPITHSYPHDWRTKKPVIFRATPQWFASIDPIKNEILEQIHKVKWNPTWGDTRISNMIRDRHDWCISRQRAWGVPIPVFYCEDGESILDPVVIEHVAQIFDEFGSNEWFKREAKDLLPEGYSNPHSPNGIFKKEMDIMDVWFDSGTSHSAVCDARKDLKFPADLYLEGADQYRGWFQSSLLTSVASKGCAPYKNIVTHGWVVDEEGKKQSKSQNNGVDPAKVMKQYGADVLRLWVSSADYHSDVKMSNEILKQLSEAYRKIRNTARFIIGNLYDFNPDKDMCNLKNLCSIDKWALAKLNNLMNKVKNGYESFEFYEVYHAVQKFCIVDMSNFYLDVLKDRLYVEKSNGVERRTAQTTIYIILNALVKMIAPILSYTSEEIWKYMPHFESEKTESIFLNDMSENVNLEITEKFIDKWDKIHKIRNEIKKILEIQRKNKIIGSSLEAEIAIYCDGELFEFIKRSKEDLQNVLIVSGIEIFENGEGNYKAEEIENLSVSISHSKYKKCERCWTYSSTVGQDSLNPTICKRCIEVLN